ncbi:MULTISPECIES: LysR substrate-binding domain-containing protein [Halomonas]|uniref:LysR substrate-binding domain-containing protein n=1 Tax=Halomonas TaxID=2745 RepID=UPI001C9511C7|nr:MULTISPECIES: LysR substrate-binding domain-containing protein [Halomonas]MBY6208661.1 LysR family transcriptional regulator [Halomonas sp. DP3Y7-2]MBY6227132.1 LysR family transcriptional regulator [Halomonas sp. DP3Y7-1]MCA0915119.1 LysR family transcriptional regulator [Halomonas denitrificans]
MSRQLPTMISLSCFETTARHLSITKAAEELNLTLSAVSKQIKKLERELGCALFHREKQRLSLTDSGQQYLSVVSKALHQIDDVTRSLGSGTSDLVTVGAEPSFTSRWLLPRLGDFKLKHPEVTTDIMNDLRHLYDGSEDFDVGILYGDGQWPEFESHFLIQGELVVVCTPALFERYGPIDDPRDLLRYPVLHHGSYAPTPQLSSTYLWLQGAGLDGEAIKSIPGQHFEHFRFLLDAAEHGLGATVLPAYFVEAELSKGQLVQASRTAMVCGAYYVAIRRQRLTHRPTQLFARWLLEETT